LAEAAWDEAARSATGDVSGDLIRDDQMALRTLMAGQ
jgi:hypothetical protein